MSDGGLSGGAMSDGGLSRGGLSARLCVARGSFRLELDLDVAPGEVVALLGPNGAGKSSALGALAGLLPAVALNIGHILARRGSVFFNSGLRKRSRAPRPIGAEAAGLHISNVDTERRYLLGQALADALQSEL